MRKYISLVLVLLFALAVSGCFLKPPPPTKATLTGQVVVPPEAVRQVGGQALAGATVNIIDPKTGNIVATTTTDAEGNYRVEVPPGGPYIVEAVKGDLKVLDVSPQVEVGQTYNLGVADATSTAVALVFQAEVAEGTDPTQINPEELAQSPEVQALAEKVEQVLAAGEDPTTSPEVITAVDAIVSPPAPGPVAAPGPTVVVKTITNKVGLTSGVGGPVSAEWPTQVTYVY